MRVQAEMVVDRIDGAVAVVRAALDAG